MGAGQAILCADGIGLPRFRRLTPGDSIGISANSCWTGCAPHSISGCRRGPQERPETLFFAVTQDFNGLRGSLRGPIVFADVRTLGALGLRGSGL